MDEAQSKDEMLSRELENYYQAGVAYGLQLATEMGDWDQNLVE